MGSASGFEFGRKSIESLGFAVDSQLGLTGLAGWLGVVAVLGWSAELLAEFARLQQRRLGPFRSRSKLEVAWKCKACSYSCCDHWLQP
jgi:hypothetical protein